MTAPARPPPRRPAPTVVDPAHLHLAARAMAYPVLSGTLSFMEASGALALAAIADGALDRLSDAAFTALCSRLENSIVQASIAIDHQAADAIRRVIQRPIAERRPREQILLTAHTTNLLRGHGTPGGHLLRRLPDRVVEEICRDEVRAFVARARNTEAARVR